MLSEISYREKDKPPYEFVYKWSLKKQNEQGLTDTENTQVVAQVEGGGQNRWRGLRDTIHQL